jgi:hypothetical protein
MILTRTTEAILSGNSFHFTSVVVSLPVIHPTDGLLALRFPSAIVSPAWLGRVPSVCPPSVLAELALVFDGIHHAIAQCLL